MGSPGHQGQNAAGPLERRGQDWKRGAQGNICSLHFLCCLPIFAFFFLFNRLASPAQLLRPPRHLPTAPRAPSSTSSPVPLSWLNWLCQELGPFNYSYGCGVTLTSVAVNSLWAYSYPKGSTLYHLSLTALVATLLVSTGLTRSVSAQPDWLWGRTVCSALWEAFCRWAVARELPQHRVSRKTASLKSWLILAMVFSAFPFADSGKAVSLCTSKAICVWRKASHHFLNLLIVLPPHPPNIQIRHASRVFYWHTWDMFLSPRCLSDSLSWSVLPS